MSRIEEALRRAHRGTGSPGGTYDVGAHQDAFVTAWPGDIDAPPVSTARDLPTPEHPVPAPRIALAERRPVRRFNSKWRELLAMPDGSPMMVEQFRRLAAALHSAQSANGIRRLMVTSASPADGKTLTAVNLALVMSESYRRRVFLMDADLRRPSLGSFVDLADAQGLSEGLRDENRKLAVVELSPTLTMLPAGQPDMDPIVGLSSPRMRNVIEEGARRFDWVIVDAPPVGAVADASLLAEHVDGILLVVRVGQTQHDGVQRAIDTLGREKILGVVLNGLDRMPEPYGYSYAEPGKASRWD